MCAERGKIGNDSMIIADIMTSARERAILTEYKHNGDQWKAPPPPIPPSESNKELTYYQLQYQTEIWLQEFKECCELFNRQANFVIKNDFLLSTNREKIELLSQLLEKVYYGILNLDKLIRDKEELDNECRSTRCMYLNAEIKGHGERENLYRSILQVKQNLEEAALQIESLNEFIKEKWDRSPIMKITRILSSYANTLEAAERKIQLIEQELPKLKHLGAALLSRKPVL